MSVVAPGTCRHCGCHGEACTLPDGEKCSWTDRSCTFCNAPGCQRAEVARLNAVRAARPLTKKQQLAALLHKGWGWGAACDEVYGSRRPKRRVGGKGKAA
jgi:hypothetical protein